MPFFGNMVVVGPFIRIDPTSQRAEANAKLFCRVRVVAPVRVKASEDVGFEDGLEGLVHRIMPTRNRQITN